MTRGIDYVGVGDDAVAWQRRTATLPTATDVTVRRRWRYNPDDVKES